MATAPPRERTSSEPRSPAGRRTRNGIASFPSPLAANPYQDLLYRSLSRYGFVVVTDSRFEIGWLRRARARVGVVHFHWPEPHWRHERGPAVLRTPLTLVKTAVFALRLASARAFGYRVVWTVHQVLPHEVVHPRLDLLGARTLARLAHALIVHDRGTLESAGNHLGGAVRKATVVPHGSYAGVYPAGRSRTHVRRELGIAEDAFVFLCFGDLRAYKQAGRLIEAFTGSALPGATLLLAGVPADGETERAIVEAAGRDPRIRPVLGFVAVERVAELFGAVDAAVVARTDGGTSGSLILALSLGTPIVAARRRVYDELLGSGEAGWLFDPDCDGDLKRALEEAAATPAERLVELRRAALRRAEALDWDEIGARTAAVLGRA